MLRLTVHYYFLSFAFCYVDYCLYHHLLYCSVSYYLYYYETSVNAVVVPFHLAAGVPVLATSHDLCAVVHYERFTHLAIVCVTKTNSSVHLSYVTRTVHNEKHYEAA